MWLKGLENITGTSQCSLLTAFFGKLSPPFFNRKHGSIYLTVPMATTYSLVFVAGIFHPFQEFIKVNGS